MRFLKKFFLSMTTMGSILCLLIIFLAIGTFIESRLGRDAAQIIIYKAKWFELLLLWLGIILLYNMLTKKLFQQRKWAVLLFHLSFLLILLGAFVTRYFGFQGVLPLREGETSANVTSEESYIRIQISEGNKQVVRKKYPVLFSAFTKNKFYKSFKIDNHRYYVSLEKYIPNVGQVITPSSKGKPIFELIYTQDLSMGFKESPIGYGDLVKLENTLFSFGDQAPADVVFSVANDSLQLISPQPLTYKSMQELKTHRLPPNTPHRVKPNTAYTLGSLKFVIPTYHPKAVFSLVPGKKSDNAYDALVFTISEKTTQKELVVYGKKLIKGKYATLNFDDHRFRISYGSLIRKLPFKFSLKDFILERYPGSQSPSSFTSKVVLDDSTKNYSKQADIFMNNVLAYGGYRFYQSSYDKDEKGSILSVNQDSIGSGITYAGYSLLFLGMLLSLFHKKTRFRSLLRIIRKAATILIFCSFTCFSFAKSTDTLPVLPKFEAYRLSEVCVQDKGGRIKPLHTLANEVILKVSGTQSLANHTASQVFFSMMAYPISWQKVPMIKVKNKQIREILGIKNTYASFQDFFQPALDETHNPYKLADYVNDAYRKQPTDQHKFDKDIIKVDEKFSICFMIYSQQLLRIFPRPSATNSSWMTPHTEVSLERGEKSFIRNGVMLYLEAVVNNQSQQAAIFLKGIHDYQQRYGGNLIPSHTKVGIEILYNKLYIFSRIFPFYLAIGVLLSFLLILKIVKPTLKINLAIKVLVGFIIILFGLHSIGLGLRWYISGHAPWSNGYESMIYISWVTMLAGLVFGKHSRFSVAVTSCLTGLFLLVAHLNWMSPEITNLVPVLKSYWLMIHVAVIIAGYGFFALGSFLAGMTLFFLLISNPANAKLIGSQVKKLTHITESALTVGLYFLTIGTFLGGIWANQSWGRYWGWDPKEVWALISILVYVLVLHLDKITQTRNLFLFNLAAFIAFSSIIMTYVGVNFFLSGLHSYAGEGTLSIPSKLWFAVAILALFLGYSFRKYKQNKGILHLK